MSKKDEKESLFCSFCGKSQKEVKKLIEKNFNEDSENMERGEHVSLFTYKTIL